MREPNSRALVTLGIVVGVAEDERTGGTGAPVAAPDAPVVVDPLPRVQRQVQDRAEGLIGDVVRRVEGRALARVVVLRLDRDPEVLVAGNDSGHLDVEVDRLGRSVGAPLERDEQLKRRGDQFRRTCHGWNRERVLCALLGAHTRRCALVAALSQEHGCRPDDEGLHDSDLPRRAGGDEEDGARRHQRRGVGPERDQSPTDLRLLEIPVSAVVAADVDVLVAADVADLGLAQEQLLGMAGHGAVAEAKGEVGYGALRGNRRGTGLRGDEKAGQSEQDEENATAAVGRS